MFAMASLIFGWITSRSQANSEREKQQSEIKENVLIEAIRTKHLSNPDIADNLRFFLNAGIIKDENGSLRSFVKNNPTPAP